MHSYDRADLNFGFWEWGNRWLETQSRTPWKFSLKTVCSLGPARCRSICWAEMEWMARSRREPAAVDTAEKSVRKSGFRWCGRGWCRRFSCVPCVWQLEGRCECARCWRYRCWSSSSTTKARGKVRDCCYWPLSHVRIWDELRPPKSLPITIYREQNTCPHRC